MRASRNIKALILLILLYAAGECFVILTGSEEKSSVSSWAVICYFAIIFIITCLFCWMCRSYDLGKRLLFVLGFLLCCCALDLLMAGIGVSRSLQNMFGVIDPGEFGTAAVFMIKANILIKAVMSAALISQIVICLYLWLQGKQAAD